MRNIQAACHYCGKWCGFKVTRDHIVPKSMVRRLKLSGGHTFHDINLVMACERCNQKKKDRWPTCQCVRCRRAVKQYNLLVIERARYM